MEPFERRRIEVLRGGGLEDHELRSRATVPQQLRQQLDVVAALQLRRVVTHDLDRAPQPVEPPRLVRPDERLQQPRAFLGRDVDGIQVDAAAAHDRHCPLEQIGRRRQPIVAGELERAAPHVPLEYRKR